MRGADFRPELPYSQVRQAGPYRPRVLGWVAAVVSIQVLRVKNWPTMEPDLRQSFVLRVALGQVATLPFLAAGPAVVGWGVEGVYWLVAGMVFSVLAAMFEAWVLLIEINR